LLSSISAAALRNIFEGDLQSLAALADLELLHRDHFDALLFSALEGTVEHLKHNAWIPGDDSYEKHLQAQQLHSFGMKGTRRLLSALGIEEASADFFGRAAAAAAAAVAKNQTVATSSDSAASSVKDNSYDKATGRVFGYLEFCLEQGASDDRSVKVEGSDKCWSGAAVAQTAMTAGIASGNHRNAELLRAVQLAYPAAAVDRARCAEFKLLTSLLKRAREANVVGADRATESTCGVVMLYTTLVPCPSCVGVLAQVRRLLPSVLICVGFAGACPPF